MAYSADSFTALEVPTLAKMNKLWSNDASFNDGTGIANNAIKNNHILSGELYTSKVYNPYKFKAVKTGSNQATAAGVAAKVTFPTERFDTSNNFDSVTNHRFTAPVAGFYFVHANIQTLNGTSSTDNNVQLYKNGSLVQKGGNLKNGVYPQHPVSAFLQLAAGDYLEIFFINIVAADSIEGNTAGSSGYFEGWLVSAL